MKQITPVRLMASSMSGQWLRVDGFQEYPDPITGVTKQWCSLTQGGDICMLNPYPASNSVQVSFIFILGRQPGFWVF